MDTLGLPPSGQGDDYGKGGTNRPPSAQYDESDITFASDWQMQSLLFFAERTRQLLSEGTNAQTETHKTLCALVGRFMEVVTAYYEHGIDLLGGSTRLFGTGRMGPSQKPFERRRFIERIGEEWALLMMLASSAQLLPENDAALSVIKRVIAVATDDLKLREGHTIAVLLHFGRHFELIKFRYAPATVVLGIPVSSLYCPWEWPVIWHEAAGIYIEELRAGQNTPVTALVQTLAQTVQNDAIWQQWKTDYHDTVRGLEAAAASSGLADILTAEGRPAERVVRNWAEELIEDAVSVLCLGEGAAATLEQVLSQHYGSAGVSLAAIDIRHPPSQLRVQVAHALSYRMGLRASDAADAGARALAQTIFAAKDKITRRTFTPADAAMMDGIIAAIERNEVSSLPEQAPQQVAATIAAIAQAALQGRVRAERIREYMYRHSALFPAGIDIQPDAGFVNGLSAANFAELVFSQSDAAVSVEEHPSHEGNVTVMVSFSGVRAHGRGHSGSASWTHSAFNHT